MTSPGARKDIMAEMNANIAYPAPCSHTSSTMDNAPFESQRRLLPGIPTLEFKDTPGPKDKSLGCTHTNQLGSSMQKDNAAATELVLPYNFL